MNKCSFFFALRVNVLFNSLFINERHQSQVSHQIRHPQTWEPFRWSQITRAEHKYNFTIHTHSHTRHTSPHTPSFSFFRFFSVLSTSDAMPFKEILEWMQSKNMIHLAPAVAKLGVQNLQQLKEIERTTLQARQWSLGDIDIFMNLLHEHNVPHDIQNLPVPRRDFPKLEPRQRGSLKRALEAALPNCQRERIESLEEDFYSNSSKPSQQSLFTTWSRVAAAWQLPPIPITRQLLLAVGASMKYAGYRSPKNYFYKAAQVHREVLQQDLPPHLHLLMQKILRSITRGQGPTPFKDSFELELFHIPLPRSGLPRHGNWFTDRFASRDITIISCWWMLRGIEAAAAKLHQSHLVSRDQPDQIRLFYITSTEERPNRPMRQQRPSVHLQVGKPQPLMPIPCHHTTHQTIDTTFPSSQPWPYTIYTYRCRRIPIQTRYTEDIFLRDRTNQHTINQTWTQRRTTTSLWRTCVPSFRCPIPIQDGLLPWSHPTDWTLGIRCRQTIYTRSTTGSDFEQSTKPYTRHR